MFNYHSSFNFVTESVLSKGMPVNVTVVSLYKQQNPLPLRMDILSYDSLSSQAMTTPAPNNRTYVPNILIAWVWYYHSTSSTIRHPYEHCMSAQHLLQ